MNASANHACVAQRGPERTSGDLFVLLDYD